MKKIIKSIIGAVAVIAMIAVGLKILGQITERKDSYEKYADFFSQEEDFDVLFFGTSHVINGVYPMELWEDYGIVSYNFGGHGNRIATTYWVMRNALEYTSPKLVVIDCQNLEDNRKVVSLEYTHISFDAFPLTKTKIEAVMDFLDESKGSLSLLWEFSTYHSRWLELTEEDFNPEPTTTKGAERRINVATANTYENIDSSQKMEGSTISVDYLEMMIEYCQDNGIEVLLTYIPYPANETQQEAANSAFDIAEKYGVNYLDYDTLLEQVDFSTDCYDAASHLNPSGANKITDYIGQYIMDNYDIDDQRDNEAYSDWNDDYEAYKETKLENLTSQTEKTNFVMLLYDRSISSCVFMSSAVKEGTIMWNLYENLGISDEMLLSTEPRLIFVDVYDDTVECVYLDDELGTNAGTLMLRETDGGYEIIRNGAEVLSIDSSESLAFIVFDKDTKEVLVKRYGSELD